LTRDIIIYGAGSHATEIAWLIEEINGLQPRWNILGYLDDDKAKHGQTRFGYPVLGGAEYLKGLSGKTAVAIGIGQPQARCCVVERLAKDHVEFPVLIHPSAIMSPGVETGKGCIIAAGTVLTVNIKLGHHVHVNVSCTVNHGSLIGDYCTIGPGTGISGDVSIGAQCFIGVGSRFVQGVHVGPHSVVGAGAVVIRDIPAHAIAVGNPAIPRTQKNQFKPSQG
jgi:sugar O-acyltransferase (sialic acid O-acetyltransferase NeuD family)